MKYEQLIRAGLASRIGAIRRLRDATGFISANFQRNTLDDYIHQTAKSAEVPRCLIEAAADGCEEPLAVIEPIIAYMKERESV